MLDFRVTSRSSFDCQNAFDTLTDAAAGRQLTEKRAT